MQESAELREITDGAKRLELVSASLRASAAELIAAFRAES
jgi:hypothetical protein